jgi:Fe-S cluster assembly iron-binding protein IscA
MVFANNSVLNLHFMKVSTENDNNFEYDKITIVVDNLPLNRWGEYPL